MLNINKYQKYIFLFCLNITTNSLVGKKFISFSDECISKEYSKKYLKYNLK